MAAKYAPVAPIRLLEQLQTYRLLGDYNLILAHDVLENKQRYKDLFANHIGPLILDNSVIETGQSLSPEKIIDAAEWSGADVLCLPDVLHSRERTVREADMFTQAVLSRRWQWLAVPQGETPDEVLMCAKDLMDLCLPDYWGVPRWMANEFGTREEIVEDLWALHPAKIHLLGCSENLHDDIKCARLHGVSGIDSANPVNFGQQLYLLFRDEYFHAERQIGDYDYWKETELTPESVMNILKLRSLLI